MMVAHPSPNTEARVADHIYKTIEITGSSSSDLESAMRGAVAKASETVRNLDWFELTNVRGHIEGSEIAHFQVTMKIGFRLD
jgi:dodecin